MWLNRMAKGKSTRKGKGIVGRLWGPFGHVLNATGESIGNIAKTAGNVTKRTIKGVRSIGNSWTRHTNMAVRNFSKKQGGGKRKGGKNKRRMTRKH
jgi:hypothetical protein